MIQYLALVWNDSDPHICENARRLLSCLPGPSTKWVQVLNQPGLVVQCRTASPDTTYALSDTRGVVLGRLFASTYCDEDDTHQRPPDPVHFDEAMAQRVVSSGGLALFDTHWGRYVAFILDRATGKKWIIRDPAGQLPCQHVRLHDVDIYFSRIDDIDCFGSSAFPFNRRYIVSQITVGLAYNDETGLEGVTTVLAGQQVEHTSSQRTVRFAWNPLEISQRDNIEDVDQAISLVRKRVRSSVHAWASCFDGIALKLSGGLDSSIVAACLRNAPTHPKVIAKNYYDDRPSSDERRFARMVAEHCELPLIELSDAAHFSLSHGLSLPRTLHPTFWMCDYAHIRNSARFNQEHGLAAEFTGQAGDELFHRSGQYPDAVDYVQRKGLRPQLLTVALNDALIDSVSVWHVLRTALKHGVHSKPIHVLALRSGGKPCLINEDLCERALKDESTIHPLFRGAIKIPYGKLQQAYQMCANATAFSPPQVDYFKAAEISPLFSQPVVDVALRTPVYVLRAGGRDRGVARSAFSGELPDAILRRASKASGTSHLHEVVMANLDVVRELLLEGYLMREGILDRRRTEAALAGSAQQLRWTTMELLSCLAVEGWVRSWTSRRSSVAA